MRWGLIVRCDQGGLASQTAALHKHLEPDRILIVRVEDPRGDEWPEQYMHDPNVMLLGRRNHITDAEARAFTRGLDHVVSVEGFYGRPFDRLRVKTTVVANPELFDPHAARVDRVVVPTPWELGRMPAGTEVLPHPVEAPGDPSYVRARTEVKTFLHVAAPAMLDRNGTQPLMDALSQVRHPCHLIVRAANRKSPNRGQSTFRVGSVTVHWDDRPVKHWWENYPPEADCLVLPRRYGGLCLVAQEAAACGLPNLMTDLAPQTWWPGWRTQVRGGLNYQMKGGVFRVHTPNPRSLALRMTMIAGGSEDVAEQSVAASEWAASLSWDRLLPRWEALCRDP